MSEATNRDVLSWAEVGRQQVELLPSRTVLSTCAPWHVDGTDDPSSVGGTAGDGGWGFGGDGGDGGDATVEDNVNNGFIQINVAVGGPGGYGGWGVGGDADGGDGGVSGDDTQD